MVGVQFTDVTLRDGLQMESRVFSLDDKLSLLRLLGACGFDRIEITSFVNPTKVPQFADSEAFCQKVSVLSEELPELMAFAPNEKGCERLLKFALPWVACFVSVSETFNKKNVNATVDESLYQVECIVKRVRQADRKVRVYVSTVFGCPYQGTMEVDRVSRVLQRVASLQPDEIALGDTIGVATPNQVGQTLDLLRGFFPLERTAMHFHNTYGLAIAAAEAAYNFGVYKFDGATGGIGGCPYAKGASGNVASEDLLYAFYRQGQRRSFPVLGFQRVLELLKKDFSLKVQSRLSEIWEKGGDWFGAPEDGGSL